MISGRGRWSRGQIAAVVGVVVVVLGLFGFMAFTGGSDGSTDEVAAEGTTSVVSTSTTAADTDDGPAPTAAPMPTAAPTTEPPVVAGEDVGDGFEDNGEDLAAGQVDQASPVDVGRFCAGASGITALEGAMSGAFSAADLEGIRRAVAEHRAGWTTAVADLIEGGPPRNRVEYERYRDVFLWVIGVVDTDGNLERIGNGYPPEYRDRSTNPDDVINATVGVHCG